MHPSRPRTLVVSIHDVSPLTWETTRRILSELRELGVPRCALLVIPNHHHRGHFLKNPGFCDWLREQEAVGHEIVIHGYFHQRERRVGESVVQKWITRVYTRDEGEFFDLSEEAAFAAATQAQGEFRRIGLHPCGFIAPAWLLSPAAERALKRAGCAYTTRLGSLLDLRSGARDRSQSMVYSVSKPWRRALSLGWNALLFHRLRPNPLLRIGIHPPDFEHPKIRRQIRRSIARALADRTPLTYESWLGNASRNPAG